MNTSSPGAVSGRGTHPAIIVAAVAVTAFAVVGIAALMGWLPSARSDATTPAAVVLSAQQVSGGSSAEYPVPAEPEPAPAPAKPAPRAADPKQAFETQGPRIEGKVSGTPKTAPAPVVAAAPAATPASPQATTPRYTDTPSSAPPPAKPVCANCGVIESVTTIEKPGEASGAGAVIGGVLGGVLGHQVGGGRGKDVATVVGAAGGAYAGHQVEKNRSRAFLYDVRVQLEDGTYKVIRLEQQPTLRVGDKVIIEGNRLLARG